MDKLKFFKMTAGGNDFIIFDARKEKIPQTKEWISLLCQNRGSVGADGVIYIESSRRGDFKMRYFNADGGEAEFCGNGLCCAARFAFLNVIAKRKMRIETARGMRSAEIADEGRVKVEIGSPRDEKFQISYILQGQSITGHYIVMGVPHFVIFTEDIENCKVAEIGAIIRNHPHFAPQGTNVTFAQVVDPHNISIRTYERGVEAETLACGTGSASAAVVAAKLNRARIPVRCLTRGGERFLIEASFEKSVPDVFLTAHARIVASGKLWEESLKIALCATENDKTKSRKDE